jgi:hypothetical protein
MEGASNASFLKACDGSPGLSEKGRFAMSVVTYRWRVSLLLPRFLALPRASATHADAWESRASVGAHLDLDRGAFRDRAGSLSREGRHGGGITCQKGSARALMASEKKREKSGRITVRRGAVARGRGRRALRARRTFAGVEETRLRTDEQDTADMLRDSWSAS